MQLVKKSSVNVKTTRITREIRNLVVMTPTITTQHIKQKLMAKGWTEKQINLNTINTIRTDTNVVIMIAREKGLWKDRSITSINRQKLA